MYNTLLFPILVYIFERIENEYTLYPAFLGVILALCGVEGEGGCEWVLRPFDLCVGGVLSWDGFYIPSRNRFPSRNRCPSMGLLRAGEWVLLPLRATDALRARDAMPFDGTPTCRRVGFTSL